MVVSEAFLLAVELSIQLGAENIKDLPGAYVCKVDEHWTFAINGTDRNVEVNIKGSMGIGELEPCHMAIWFNGWLAGLLSPKDGVICAGPAGNEDNFIAALKSRTAALIA
jgi:hypothetical protein